MVDRPDIVDSVLVQSETVMAVRSVHQEFQILSNTANQENGNELSLQFPLRQGSI